MCGVRTGIATRMLIRVAAVRGNAADSQAFWVIRCRVAVRKTILEIRTAVPDPLPGMGPSNAVWTATSSAATHPKTTTPPTASAA